MARTIAELRKFNRERRALQRAAARAAGIPPSDRVAAAIAEATAFAMRSGGVNIGSDGAQHLQIDAATLISAAVDILSKRAGFDAKHSRQAVARIVSPRPEHTWPGFIPSHTKTSLPASVGM